MNYGMKFYILKATGLGISEFLRFIAWMCLRAVIFSSFCILNIRSLCVDTLLDMTVNSFYRFLNLFNSFYCFINDSLITILFYAGIIASLTFPNLSIF